MAKTKGAKESPDTSTKYNNLFSAANFYGIPGMKWGRKKKETTEEEKQPKKRNYGKLAKTAALIGGAGLIATGGVLGTRKVLRDTIIGRDISRSVNKNVVRLKKRAKEFIQHQKDIKENPWKARYQAGRKKFADRYTDHIYVGETGKGKLVRKTRLKKETHDLRTLNDVNPESPSSMETALLVNSDRVRHLKAKHKQKVNRAKRKNDDRSILKADNELKTELAKIKKANKSISKQKQKAYENLVRKYWQQQREAKTAKTSASYLVSEFAKLRAAEIDNQANFARTKGAKDKKERKRRSLVKKAALVGGGALLAAGLGVAGKKALDYSKLTPHQKRWRSGRKHYTKDWRGKLSRKSDVSTHTYPDERRAQAFDDLKDNIDSLRAIHFETKRVNKRYKNNKKQKVQDWLKDYNQQRKAGVRTVLTDIKGNVKRIVKGRERRKFSNQQIITEFAKLHAAEKRERIANFIGMRDRNESMMPKIGQKALTTAGVVGAGAVGGTAYGVHRLRKYAKRKHSEALKAGNKVAKTKRAMAMRNIKKRKKLIKGASAKAKGLISSAAERVGKLFT